MLVKYHPALILGRQKAAKTFRKISKSSWVQADRVVMFLIIAGVMIGAILFS